MGGLGLGAAVDGVDGRCAACRALWADTLPTLQARHPHVVADIGSILNSPLRPPTGHAPSTMAFAKAMSQLQKSGFISSPWKVLVGGARLPSSAGYA